MSRRLLDLLDKHEPAAFRQTEIMILKGLAANAFRAGRSIRGKRRAGGSALERYADYTCECMRSCNVDEERLYERSYRLGSIVRKVFGLNDRQDLNRLIEYLYRNIGISMSWTGSEELTVTYCYFSKVYGPEQCRVMSNFDSGIISGILGGCRLVFTERITEGDGRCRACLKRGDKR